MNTQTFLKQALQHGIRLSVHGDKLDVDAPKNALTPDVMTYLKQHKPEIVAALSTHHDASTLAVLLSLPDGFQFWLAPDAMEFDHGDIPVLRRSVMNKLAASGADVKKELHSIITSMRELGGDLCVTDNSEGNRPSPDTQKAVSGEMVMPL